MCGSGVGMCGSGVGLCGSGDGCVVVVMDVW